MKLQRGTAAILLLLSLQALVVGRLSAAVLDTTEAAREEKDGKEVARPWECCDLSRCTKSFPPTCSCLDEVKKCSKNCKNCKKVVGSMGRSSRYVCQDTYGKVAPPCTKKNVDASPWKCCDKSWCTRSMPPICHCEDQVKECSKNCEDCMKVVGSSGSSSRRYVCRDTYGKVAPPCTKKTVAASGPPL